jgi:hypothetical protein
MLDCVTTIDTTTTTTTRKHAKNKVSASYEYDNNAQCARRTRPSTPRLNNVKVRRTDPVPCEP